MRRLVPRTLATLAVAGLLTTSAAGPARAAEGALIVNGVAHQNPAGCIETGNAQEMTIKNETNAPADVYGAAGCSGKRTGTVGPGDEGTLLGSSIAIF